MSSTPLIYLYNIEDIGIILLYPSGVRYLNQVGGFSCLQNTEEGVYVPIADVIVDQFSPLMIHFFDGPKWKGSCGNGIDTIDADEVDRILGLAPETRLIKVDRTRLHDSCEAWIYVDIAEVDDDSQFPLKKISGFGHCKGVLTWPNSD